MTVTATAGAAIRRGWAYLDSEAPVPARLSLDPVFQSSFAGAGSRWMILDRFGFDVGFDLGAEGFSAMVAATLLPELSGRVAAAIVACRDGNRYRFFPHRNGFAADADCTAMALTALRATLSASEVDALAAELITCRCPVSDGDLRRGVLMVYWDDGEPGARPRGRKHDPVVCANTLFAARLRPVPDDITAANLAYLGQHLTSGRYRQGTRYYPSPHAFLWAASRLSYAYADCAHVLAEPLRRATEAARPAGPLDLALWIIAREHLGQNGLTDARRYLAGMQQADGSWPAQAFYKLGRLPVYFGSPFLTTVFAVRALAGVRHG